MNSNDLNLLGEFKPMANMCSGCWHRCGFERQDNGYHTAIKGACDRCGNERLILPARHWKYVGLMG